MNGSVFISSHVNTDESYIIQFPGNIFPYTINYLKEIRKPRQSKPEDHRAESSQQLLPFWEAVISSAFISIIYHMEATALFQLL